MSRFPTEVELPTPLGRAEREQFERDLRDRLGRALIAALADGIPADLIADHLRIQRPRQLREMATVLDDVWIGLNARQRGYVWDVQRHLRSTYYANTAAERRARERMREIEAERRRQESKARHERFLREQREAEQRWDRALARDQARCWFRPPLYRDHPLHGIDPDGEYHLACDPDLLEPNPAADLEADFAHRLGYWEDAA